MNESNNKSPHNHEQPPVSERDQDHWEAEERLKPEEPKDSPEPTK